MQPFSSCWGLKNEHEYLELLLHNRTTPLTWGAGFQELPDRGSDTGFQHPRPAESPHE